VKTICAKCGEQTLYDDNDENTYIIIPCTYCISVCEDDARSEEIDRFHEICG
jgi:hypothetical protein